MYSEKIIEIEKVVKDYFNGLFYGDINLLTGAFSSNAVIYGDIHGETYIKPIVPFLDWVGERESPNDKKESFLMKILSIDLLGDSAVVKTHVPMLGKNYYDFLALHCVEGEWSIVNKLFSHVE
jgi:hypothetical protein